MFPSWCWVAGSLALLCGVPLALPLALPVRVAIAAALLASVAFAWWRTSSRGLSYFRGFDLVAKSFLSFDDNLTAIYLPVVLDLLHLGALAFSFLSIGRGRLYAQTQWYDLVEWFYQRRTKQPLSKIAGRPDGELPSLADLLRGHAAAVVKSVDVPRSTQPWYRRHLLLYVPRSGTVIYHAGFFLGVLGTAGMAWMLAFPPDDAKPQDLASGAALCVFLAVASYIAVRRRDAVHRN